MTQTCGLHCFRDPAASRRSMASSTGSRRSLHRARKGPTLQALRVVIPPGQLVGICGEVRAGPRLPLRFQGAPRCLQCSVITITLLCAQDRTAGHWATWQGKICGATLQSLGMLATCSTATWAVFGFDACRGAQTSACSAADMRHPAHTWYVWCAPRRWAPAKAPCWRPCWGRRCLSRRLAKQQQGRSCAAAWRIAARCPGSSRAACGCAVRVLQPSWLSVWSRAALVLRAPSHLAGGLRSRMHDSAMDGPLPQLYAGLTTEQRR